MEEVVAEAEFPQELIVKEAIRLAEQDGIVFIDEIDKIVNSKDRWAGGLGRGQGGGDRCGHRQGARWQQSADSKARGGCTFAPSPLHAHPDLQEWSPSLLCSSLEWA